MYFHVMFLLCMCCIPTLNSFVNNVNKRIMNTVKHRIWDHLIRDHLRTGPTKFRHFTPSDNTITLSIKCSDQLILGGFIVPKPFGVCSNIVYKTLALRTRFYT